MSDDSDDDDAKTPPRGRRITDSERHRHAQRYALGVPVVRGMEVPPTQYEENDWTGPIALADRPSRIPERELERRLRSDPSMLSAYVAKLAHQLEKLRRRDDSSGKIFAEQLDQLRDLLARPPNGAVSELQDDVKDLQRFVGAQRRALKWFAGIAGGLVITVATLIYTLGGKAERQQQLERTVEKLENRLFPTQKGPIP